MLANKRKSASFSASELSLFKKFSNENITSATIGGIGIQQEDERILVQYYVNENTLREKLTILFFKNQTTSLRIRIARFILKLLTCVLYIIRVIFDTSPILANCYGCPSQPSKTEYMEAVNKTQEEYLNSPVINWDAIYWVHRDQSIWLMQVILSIVSINETMLLIWLNYKGNIFQQLLTRRFVIELVTTIPFTTTVFYSPLRHLFVPVFLNCWLAKYALENMFNDLHRAMQRSQSALSQQLTILTATLICLVFTSVCGVQHFQRAGHRQLDLFQSTYFVIVTFSTVGYGDYVPDIWPSQLFMVVMIGIALIVLPTQFEQLAFTWMERQKLGGNYSSHRAQTEKHVVVCSTTLHTDTIMDFLNEFYAHPLLQSFFVVLLSPSELDPTMRMILSVPIWSQRVIYLQGSCLKDNDLIRARMGEAEACFILAARNYADKTAADEHTILRSWAVKDFAPNVPQYVQIVRPDNKLHVRFAEHVVCEDEFKYALLANNCLFPGSSTLVTLLLHTSRGQEGQTSKESWQRLYGKCSGNEIYHIRLGDSRFFGEYEGKSFTYASFHSHRKFGVCLVGVRPAQLPEFYEDTILLNPGPKHIMKKSDLCFYLSITKEEHSAFIVSSENGNPEKDDAGTQPASNPNKEETKSKQRGSKSEIEAQDLHLTNVVQIEIEESSKEHEKKYDSKTSEKLTKTSNLLSLPLSGSSTLGVGITDETQLDGSRRPSILPVPESFSTTSDTSNTLLPSSGPKMEMYQSKDSSPSIPVAIEDNALDNITCSSGEEDQIIKGFPPTSPYIGVTPTLCYLLKEKKQLCCLQLAQACSHCSNRTAYDYHWTSRTIILSSDSASSAIYNFIIPLRAHFRPKDSLSPIVLLLERRPDISFLDAISVFPLIYWFLGSIDNLDDLLRAGITLAENVVVVNKEINNSAEEDTLSDCNTIVAVQTMYRFFPHIKIVTELSQSNNMRFMQFNADDQYALHLSRMEKREKERGSHISYMFRLPFAAGSVFSASMLDTLLYQAFVKDYLITFVRLLLGIDQAPGSGFLTSMQINQEDLWIRSYGRLYQKLCSTTLEIPIGIYRTQESNTDINHEREQEEEAGSKEDILGEDDDNDSFICAGAKPKKRDKNSYFKLPCRGNESSRNSSEANSPVVSTSSTPKPMIKDHKQNSLTHSHLIEKAEILNLVKSRMKCLGLPEAIDHVFDKDLETNAEKNTLSYVIINPSCDLKLRNGDIIYLIRPSWGDTAAQNTVSGGPKQSEHHGNPQEGKTEVDDRGSLSSKHSLPYQKFSLDSELITHENSHHQKRSNSLRMHHTYENSSEEPSPRKQHLSSGDDILLRRSNSLRQGLGINTLPTMSTTTGLPPGGGRRRLSSTFQKRKIKHEDGASHAPPTIHIINSTSTDEINLNGQGCSSNIFTHNLGTTGATNSDSNTGTIV